MLNIFDAVAVTAIASFAAAKEGLHRISRDLEHSEEGQVGAEDAFRFQASLVESPPYGTKNGQG